MEACQRSIARDRLLVVVFDWIAVLLHYNIIYCIYCRVQTGGLLREDWFPGLPLPEVNYLFPLDSPSPLQIKIPKRKCASQGWPRGFFLFSA